MNWVLVGLVILVVIFVYLLYYFSKAVSLLQGVTTLNTRSTIPGNQMELSSGKTVYYDFWIFVVTPPTSDLTILSREFKMVLNGNTLKFNLASADVPVTGEGATNNTVSLPSMKWIFVSVNVNEKVMEVYLNGKLVKTMSMPTNLNVSNTSDLSVGSSINGYITKLRRLTKPMTPDFVWTKYLEGNGQFSGLFGSILNYFDSYRAKITLTNGDTKKELKLF